MCIRYLFLSDCGLSSLPNWKDLQHLQFADLSGNNLDAVPGNDSIGRMNIAGNQMETLVSFEQKFANLAELVVGSDKLLFLGFGLLDKVKLIVKDQKYQSLIMPPVSVINNSGKLREYLKKPEEYFVDIDQDRDRKGRALAIQYCRFQTN